MPSSKSKSVARVASHMRWSRMERAQAFSGHFIIVVTTAALLALAMRQKTDAATVPTTADVPASQALGAAQEDTVWYQGRVSSDPTSNSTAASGTLIRGLDNDWVLTVAHAIKFTGGTISTTNMTIGNGTSYKTDRGLTSGVFSMYISPSYVPGSDAGQDYAFLRLERRISSSDLVFTLGAQPQYNGLILFAGYGLPKSMLEGILPNTGNVMGFWGSFSTAGAPGWNSADDSGFFTGQHDSGAANLYDSGGSVKQFNPATSRWENIGTIVGGDGSNYTVFLGLYNADQNFRDFLANTVRPATEAATPPNLACTITSTVAQLSFSNLESNREYRVMRSSTLTGWEEAHRFTAITTVGSWSEGLAPEGRRFYRLEWNQ